MSGNLFKSIEDTVSNRDAPFLMPPEGSTVSYGRMISLSGQYAHALIALGVAKGDRVAVQTRKCAECLWLYLACLRIGAVYLPLNSAYTVAEIAYFIGDAEPALFVCDEERLTDMHRTLADGAQTVMAITGTGGDSLATRAGNMPERFETIDLSADDLAAILYTSGTTGRSKGAMISHENLRSNALALTDIWRFGSSDRLLHALPIYHTHGLFVATNTILLAGAAMLFLPKFDVEAVLKHIPNATAMMGVPTFYSRLLAHPDFTADTVQNMRLFISGSAPLSAEVHRNFTARTGLAIIGLPHADFGEAVTAIVVAADDAPIDEDAIRNELQSVLAKFKVPRRVIAMDTLPRNTMGKIQKTLLREQFTNLYRE